MYDPNFEEEFQRVLCIPKMSRVRLQVGLIDTAGSDEYTLMGDQRIHSANGVVIVYSITRRVATMTLAFLLFTFLSYSRISFESLEECFFQRVFLVKHASPGEFIAMVLVGCVRCICDM